MSKTITAAMQEIMESMQYTPVFFFDFEKDSTYYRYTNLDVNFAIRDNPLGSFLASSTTASGLYVSKGFSIDNVSYSAGKIISSTTITIDNVDSVMTSLFMTGQIRDNAANLYVGVIDDEHPSYLDHMFTLFTGYIDGWTLQESKIELTIGSPFSRWDKSNTNYHSKSCRYRRFKGTRCGYSGGLTTCDRSYTQCSARGNTANFGGFRFLPSIEGKPVQWGQFHEKDLIK